MEALYNFMPEGKLVPFVAAGVGGTLLHRTGVGKDNRAMADYGAGLKYFVTENIALRADVRHVIPFNDSNNNLLFTFGVNFFFGGAKKAAPVVQTARAAEPAAAPVVAVVRDTDGDGVFDDLDKCPGTPAGVQVDRDGCPLDTDGDGVYDYLDKCPGTPAGVKVDQDGCPPPVVQKAVPQAASAMETAIVERGRVTLNVEFDTAKSTIRKSSNEEIAKLAAVLKKFTDLKILIEGHTDNVGSAKYNEKLSQQRADAIKKNLVEKYGIEASRLSTKGYGLTKPVASNATKEGRQKNRRVEAAAEYIIKK
jgi:OOP family OmpA-OmpF porin